MPNWVMNRITINKKHEKVIRRILGTDDDGQPAVDFNRIIRMPRRLLNSSGMDWYMWALEHWGTKWNPSFTSVVDNVIEFETAWSHPSPFIEALSKKFCDLEFKVAYADEDLGNNAGAYTIKNGEIIENPFIFDYLDFALDMWQYDKEEYYAEMRNLRAEEDD